MQSTAHSRRAMLAWSGATILLAVGGGTIRAVDAANLEASDDAFTPWRMWNEPAHRGTPLALVAAAVLAANPHDTQPWLFRVSGTAIEIFADTSRNLGAMDVYLREMHIGIGCAIQNALAVAGPNGYAVRVEMTPG